MKHLIGLNRAGLTLVELIMTLTIIAIMSAMVLPSARMISKRNKEIELKRNLRQIRNAIDDYKKIYDQAVIDKKIQNVVNKSGYPKNFDELIEGYDFGGAIPDKKKFLRRVPCDPLREDKTVACEKSWGVRAYSDKECSDKLGGDDIYDVCSMSEETAIDGTKYKDW